MSESVGLVLFRRSGDGVEVLVGHLGGPFFAGKHESAWTFPKGLVEPGEEPLDTAEREFAEEVGAPAPAGPTSDLGAIRTSGKTITLFAREGELGVDLDELESNRFELEWPPRSGRTQTFPELDRLAWVSIDEVEPLLTKNQRDFVARLRDAIVS